MILRKKKHRNNNSFEILTSLRQPMKLLLTGEPGKSAVLGLPPTQKKSSEPSMVQSSCVQPVVVRMPSTEMVTYSRDTMDKKNPSNDLTILNRTYHLPYIFMLVLLKILLRFVFCVFERFFCCCCFCCQFNQAPFSGLLHPQWKCFSICFPFWYISTFRLSQQSTH